MSAFNRIWFDVLNKLLMSGRRQSPRGKETRELLHQTITVPLTDCVLTSRVRNLNYRFMAAEALWILSGDNALAPLLEVNPRMAEFSDDGVTLAGAYGPRIHSQMQYIIFKLQQDRDTRQATLTIWDRNPEPSKDIPCTVAMSFNIRDNRLNVHVYMRSSDAWLGLPYDVFSFSMVGLSVVGTLNLAAGHINVVPGDLYLTAMSQHLYQEHYIKAGDCQLEPGLFDPSGHALVPNELWSNYDRGAMPLFDRLEQLTRSRRGDPIRWWDQPGDNFLSTEELQNDR